MGQFCIELNVDIMGLFLALVIAFALMLTCVKQPPRRAMVVTHRIGVDIKPIETQLEETFFHIGVDLKSKKYKNHQHVWNLHSFLPTQIPPFWDRK